MKKKYFENLDGLRFLSFLSVFLYHSFYTAFSDLKNCTIYHFVKTDLFGNGNLGVNLFFVLSGFLITFLLIEEKKKNGQINLKGFWVRRVLRIFPLFYFCLFFGFVLFPLLKQFFGQESNESADPIFYLFFINNFDFINKGLPDSSVLGVLWSIAVEEQFYLLWAPCMYFFRKKAWILISVFTLIGWYFNTIPFEKVSQYSSFHINFTVNRFFHFGLGAALAWIIRYFPLIQTRDYLLKWIKKYTPSVFNSKKGISAVLKPENVLNGLLLIAQCLLLSYISVYILGNYHPLKERLINGWVSVGIITMAIMPISILTFFLLETRAFKYLGRISFGIYIYHLISIHLIDKLLETLGNTPLQTSYYYLLPFLSTTLSVAAAAASYEYFEKYFLTLKTNFHIG